MVVCSYIYPLPPQNTLSITYDSYLATYIAHRLIDGRRARVAEGVAEGFLLSYPATQRDIPLGALRFNGARMLFEEV